MAKKKTPPKFDPPRTSMDKKAEGLVKSKAKSKSKSNPKPKKKFKPKTNEEGY